MTIQKFEETHHLTHTEYHPAPNWQDIDTTESEQQHSYETTYNGLTHCTRGFDYKIYGGI